MVLVKVLKRKDASSVIVAVIVAMIVVQLMSFTLSDLASKLSGTQGGPYGEPIGGPDWKVVYLQPAVTAVLQVVALELLARLTIVVRAQLIRRR